MLDKTTPFLCELSELKFNFNKKTYLFTMALCSSTRSTYISLVEYFNPAFRQGIGDEKAAPADPGPEPEFISVFKLVPATLSSLLRSEGGSTMSRSALRDVVKGWPPESRVSSRS